jgi:hypothetical protein
MQLGMSSLTAWNLADAAGIMPEEPPCQDKARYPNRGEQIKESRPVLMGQFHKLNKNWYFCTHYNRNEY